MSYFFCSTDCICNEHAENCTFNTTRGTAECISCSDNTIGDNCQMCQPGYFQDLALLLNDPNICQGKKCQFYQGCSHFWQQTNLRSTRTKLFLQSHKFSKTTTIIIIIVAHSQGRSIWQCSLLVCWSVCLFVWFCYICFSLAIHFGMQLLDAHWGIIKPLLK